MSSVFTANRIAALATFLSGLAAFILGITQTLPHGWQNYALIGAGLLTKVVTVLKFLDGSQKWDALTSGPSAFPQADGVNSNQSLTDRPTSGVTPDDHDRHSIPESGSETDIKSETATESALAVDAPNP